MYMFLHCRCNSTSHISIAMNTHLQMATMFYTSYFFGSIVMCVIWWFHIKTYIWRGTTSVFKIHICYSPWSGTVQKICKMNNSNPKAGVLNLKCLMSQGIKSEAAPLTRNWGRCYKWHWEHPEECSGYMGTFSVSEQRTLQYSKAHLGIKKRKTFYGSTKTGSHSLSMDWDLLLWFLALRESSSFKYWSNWLKNMHTGFISYILLLLLCNGGCDLKLLCQVSKLNNSVQCKQPFSQHFPVTATSLCCLLLICSTEAHEAFSLKKHLRETCERKNTLNKNTLNCMVNVDINVNYSGLSD